jgi:hypothetical protein
VFTWVPVAEFEIDPKIGYRVNISTGRNAQAVYISHNQYLKERQAVLSQRDTYGLTLGDDAAANWNVDVILSTAEFLPGSSTTKPAGTTVVCGPSSETWTVNLHVEN